MRSIDLLDLQLLAGEGPAGDGGGEAAGETKGTEPAAGAPVGRRKPNPNANTVYGRRTAPTTEAAAEAAAGAQEDKKQSFEELLKDPDYKAAYDQKFQGALNERFKGAKANETKLRQLQPIVAATASKYGIQPDKDGNYDLSALIQAWQKDEDERQAVETGKSADHIRLERENQQLRQQNQERENRAAFQGLVQQGKELQKVYPGFNFQQEMQNPKFMKLLGMGESMRDAYEYIHRQELMAGTIQAAEQQIRQQVSNAVQAGSQRHVEGATGGSQPVQHVTDPKTLTKQQRADIRARVYRGEKIVW